jgi:predicted MPP superfamily phosphohydrolase
MADIHPSTPPPPRRLTRRAMLRLAGVTALAGCGTYTYGSTVEVNRLVVEEVAVTIPGLAKRWDGSRIAHLSDLHAGRTSNELIRRGLQMAVDLNPAFLVITGDFVDSPSADVPALAQLLTPFARKVETIGCPGNHDYGHPKSDLAFINHLSRTLTGAGVRMLRNDWHQPAGGKGELCFVGLEDWSSGRLDPAVLRAPPRDASVLLLSHNPDSYDDLWPERWHLMLAGHTHGGQVCLPGIGPLILPVTHRERAAGLFHLDPSQPHRALYVTRGVGHLLKVRLFCPPEVTCITLHSA